MEWVVGIEFVILWLWVLLVIKLFYFVKLKRGELVDKRGVEYVFLLYLYK